MMELWNQFLSLDGEMWLWLCLLIAGGSVLGNGLILAHIAQDKMGFLSFMIRLFYSKSLLWCFAFCVFDLLFVVMLYGMSLYALFIACVLFLFFVMSYIDAVFLAVPDWINFLCFFGIFGGLYYLEMLESEHFIAAFCVAGGLAVLRIFGSFVFRKEILGEADIIVFASMGSLVMIYPSLYLIVLACVLAMGYILCVSLFSLKGKEIALSGIKVPFVVFLTIAFVLVLIYLQYGESFV